MKRLLLIVAALLSTNSCVYFAHLHAPDWWRADPAIRPFAEDASAVILRYDETFSMKAFKTQVYTEYLVHSSIKVLTEAGLGAADLSLISYKNAELQEVSARVVKKDGRTIEVDPERILEEDIIIDGEALRRTVMRVPQVEVGSVIEFYYLYYTDGYRRFIRRFLPTNLPVQEYNLDFTMGQNIVFEVRSYNTDQQPQIERDGKGYHFTLHAENIPKQKKETFGPDGTLSEPWWVMSTKRVGDYWVNEDWDTAMRNYAEELMLDHDDEYVDDFDPDLDDSACGGDVLCKVKLGLDYVRKTVTYYGDEEWWQITALPKVVKKGKATNQEINLLLYTVLDSMGVKVRLGAVNRYLTRGHDFTLPLSLWFNHTIVFVEPQAGFTRRLAVDASCEYCKPGQLPWWSRDVKGMWVEPYQNVTGRIAAKTELYGLPSLKMKGGARRAVLDVKLGADGKADIDLSRSWRGPSARGRIRDTIQNTPQELADEAQAFSKTRFKSARGTTVAQPLTCDRFTASCTQRVSARAETLGVQSGNDLIVPLTVMHNHLDGVFNTDQRQYDIFLQFAETEAETMHLHVPPGYRIKSLPPEVKQDGEAFRYALSVRPTTDGVDITRRLDLKRGRYNKKYYAKLAGPVRAFEQARTQAVVLERTTPAPGPAAPPPATAPGLDKPAAPATPPPAATPDPAEQDAP